jgi:probable F420-dependent oxidoreductase
VSAEEPVLVDVAPLDTTPLDTPPLRFGIGPADLDLAGGPGAWPDLARRAEGLGYSSLNVGDHPSATVGSGAGPFALLAAAAAVTTTLRVGALVLGSDFRPPAVVAQEALALAHLSGGRLELGLGAGWAAADYAATGLDVAPASVRIARLEEAVAIVRAIFAGRPVDHAGEHLHARLGPNPLAAVVAAPPLVLGGGGPRMLALAGRVADIVTLNVALGRGLGTEAYSDATAAATDAKLAIVRAAAAAREQPLRELQVYVHVARITDEGDDVVDRLAARWELPPADVRASPHVLVGSAAEVADTLVERRARWGLSYVTWGAGSMAQMAPVVERLAGT